MKNSELKIVLDSLVRVQMEVKNIASYLDKETDRPFFGLFSATISIEEGIKEVKDLIEDQCDECSEINGNHDEKCGIGRQEKVDTAEYAADCKTEDEWIYAQQNVTGKI